MKSFLSNIAAAALSKLKSPAWLGTQADKFLIILALIVLALGLFRYRGKQAAAETAAPTLVFTQWWQNELDAGTLEKIIEEFEALHQDIKITLDTRPYEEIRELLSGRTLLESGEEPGAELPGDILALDPLWFPELAGKGILDSREPLFLLSFFYPLFYNIDMLKEAGFNSPPKTWSEFLAFTKAVTDPSGGRYGIAFAGRNPQGACRDLRSWILASGALTTNAEEPGLAAKPVEKVLEFLETLGKEKVIHPGSRFMNEDEKRDAFTSGKAAFMICPIQEIEALRRNMEGGFGFTALPVPDGYAGKPVFSASSWSLGLYDGSGYPEEAGIFMDFLAEKAPVLAEKLHAVPGAASNPPSLTLADPFYSKAWDLYTAGDLIRESPALEGEITALLDFFFQVL
ncbi:MAG: extracellular solute-binding protein [Treponema sp.]|nr:extracellular solute-binding protein [Treponema sp.]